MSMRLSGLFRYSTSSPTGPSSGLLWIRTAATLFCPLISWKAACDLLAAFKFNQANARMENTKETVKTEHVDQPNNRAAGPPTARISGTYSCPRIQINSSLI